MSVRFVSNITKEYPDMIKVVIYKEPMMFEFNDGHVKRQKHQVEKSYTPDITSLSRTKQSIRDLILCNDFDWFCTFTFDPDKVDRFNLQACWGKMSRWVHHQKELDPDFSYLLVPEQHKSGAWHFHGLLKHFNGTVSDSKHFSSTGRRVYNLTCYRSGFSTAVQIDDKEAVSQYVAKYITKEFVKQFNQRRFFCSNNLIRPKKSINSNKFRNTLPIFRRKVAEYSDRDLYILAGE